MQKSSDVLIEQMLGPKTWSGKDQEQQLFDFLDSIMSPH